MTSIELFAGGGGLALGLEQANIEPLLLIEQNRLAVQTLKTNRPNWNIIQADIHTVDFLPYFGKVDIVSGGCPCQPFSYAGKQKGLGDPRGTLFAEFARCLKETQPKFFIFENVKGLLTHDKKRTFQTILQTFQSLGYFCAYQLFDCAQYNIPQSRQRLILIGIKSLTPVNIPWPQPSEHKITLAEALKDCPQSIGAKYSEKEQELYHKYIKPGQHWNSLPDPIAREYMGSMYTPTKTSTTQCLRRLTWDEVCPTLITTPKGKMIARCHPDEDRPLTVREYARLQTFPDSWTFCGSLSAQYTQIGNAVPVELARQIGETIKKIEI